MTSPAEPYGERFLRRLEALPDRALAGFLKGAIDLVFRWDGRYYLLDWKSNHLGDRAGDYAPEALARAMDEQLYRLQYLLYTLALDRLLARRLPGYLYERDFGGAIYVFLRGLSAEAPGQGVFFHKPGAAMVRELAACLLAPVPLWPAHGGRR